MQQTISNFDSLSEEDFSKHAGKWVAVVDNKIVISSDSFKEIHQFTKEKYPNKRALIGKLPEDMPMVFSMD